MSVGGTPGRWLEVQRQRGRTMVTRIVLTATPCLPTPPSLPVTSPPRSLFLLFPQIETSQLEPEIARATSSRTVVYNKGL